MRRVRVNRVNELWKRYLLLSGTKMHTLPIPTTRILRGHTPSRQRYHYFSSFSLTLHFLISFYYLKNTPWSKLAFGYGHGGQNGPSGGKGWSLLENMVQSLTRVEGIKPKVAKFCPGVELHTLANHYMLGRLKPCGTQPLRARVSYNPQRNVQSAGNQTLGE